MATYTIATLLGGQVPAGSPVTVRGWVRTRRDSKAGLSFISLHDGSCFDALQVVAPATLTNYGNEVLQLTAGCAVIVSGEWVASQGKGQAMELRAEVTGMGNVRDVIPFPRTPGNAEF